MTADVYIYIHIIYIYILDVRRNRKSKRASERGFRDIATHIVHHALQIFSKRCAVLCCWGPSAVGPGEGERTGREGKGGRGGRGGEMGGGDILVHMF